MISVHGRSTRGELALDIDLEIGAGVTFVVGPNGVGKSTLLRLIAGLEALDDGTVELDGRIVDAPADGRFVPAHQRPIAMAFQDHRLFPHLSVLDNVAFPARRRGERARPARAAARSHLDAVGLADLSRRRPAELSVGQRQRAALARALATPAEVLLLDEPLAAIDEAGRAFIRDRLHGATHQTVVWVSHDQADIDPGAARISFDGTVVRKTLRS
ncbi:MAG: ATP-binding cassette domain-containing protein [Acidimicrobiales bacterium]